MKNIFLLSVVFILISCRRENHSTFVNFKIGNTEFKGIPYIMSFDDSNYFESTLFSSNTSGISGYPDNENYLAYNLVFDKEKEHLKYIKLFAAGNNSDRFYTDQGGNNISIIITRDDSVSGGIIQGSFSGILENYYSGNNTTVQGTFKVKIK